MEDCAITSLAISCIWRGYYGYECNYAVKTEVTLWGTEELVLMQEYVWKCSKYEWVVLSCSSKRWCVSRKNIQGRWLNASVGIRDVCDSSTPEELGSEVEHMHEVIGTQNNRSVFKKAAGRL